LPIFSKEEIGIKDDAVIVGAKLSSQRTSIRVRSEGREGALRGERPLEGGEKVETKPYVV